jgi:SAM-dependent methyltransferase
MSKPETESMQSAPRARFAWWIKRGSGIVFDALHGVDTTAGNPVRPLKIASANRDKAVPYDPAPWRTLRRSLQLGSLQAAGFTFVDIGCGKGKVLLSALALPFNRIVGVEFSPLLVRIAKRNIASARFVRRQCRAVQIICCDAVEYSIPDEPTVFFFYNPFSYEIMETVLGNIARAQARVPCPRYLILYAASSSLPKVIEFLQRASGDCAHLQVSSSLGQRSLNIFKLAL